MLPSSLDMSNVRWSLYLKTSVVPGQSGGDLSEVGRGANEL